MKKLASVFKNKEIMNRIFFTLMVLFVFRLGANIVVPGADTTRALEDAFNSTNAIGLLNMIGGGALQSFSIFALGVSPYITAQIIIQLLSMDVLPALTELTKSGEYGRKKMDMATRYLSLMLGAVQAYAMIKLMEQNQYVTLTGGGDFWNYLLIIGGLLGGCLLAIWMGDQITEKGIGNGISMLIFSGIVVSIPKQIWTAFSSWILGNMQNTELGNALFVGILQFVIYILMFLAIIGFVVYIEMAKRKIPVQHSAKGSSAKANQTSFLPIKLNSSGVLPVIFASSILTAPVIIGSFFGAGATDWWTKIFDPNGRFYFNNEFFNNGTGSGFWFPFGMIIYTVLIVLFSFFYAQIQINPEKMAENFQKNGSYIPGIRPGAETERYVKKVVNRVSCMGAIFLSFIALLPVVMNLTGIFGELTSTLALGGTGLIIVVGVCMEVKNQAEGLLAGKSFEEASARGRDF